MKYIKLFESTLKLHPDIVEFLIINSNFTMFDSVLDLQHDKNATEMLNYLRPAADASVYFSNDTKHKGVDVNEFNWNSQKETIKIGRCIKQLLGNRVNDREIELFVNTWKAYFSKKPNIKIVSGEDIRHWYHNKNYNEFSEYNSLGKSCMSYDNCQKYLDIYVKNPEVCSMIIMLDDDNKLLARAILWKTTDNKQIIDRIYFTHKWNENKVISWAKENLPDAITIDKLSRSLFSKIKIKLNEWKFSYYPYMDNMRYLNYNTGILLNFTSKGPLVKLTDTQGTYFIDQYDWVLIKDEDVLIPKTDAIRDDNGVWSRKKGFIQKFKSFFRKNEQVITESYVEDQKYHQQVVLDVFQDILDEYEFYKYAQCESLNGSCYGYMITNSREDNRNAVSITMFYIVDGHTKPMKSESIISKSNIVVSRLEKMGYRTKMVDNGIWFYVEVDYSNLI